MARSRKRRAQRPRRRLAPWVGPWFREMRKAAKDPAGLGEIAERLRRDKSAISRIETGELSIPSDDLPLFLSAYRVTAEQFAERVGRQAA